MKRPLVFAAFAFFLLALPAQADVKNARDAKVVFHAKGPAGFKIDGKGSELQVKDDGKQITFTVPLKDLKTGIDLRDRHMTEKYLEVEKYPNAVLTVPWSEIKKPASGATEKGRAKGVMALHGKIKEVPFVYGVVREGNTYKVKGKVPLDIRDYGIVIPSYLGVTVKPDIDVAVEFVAEEG